MPRNNTKNEDDSSVDSKGNIRDLIDYEYSDESEDIFPIDDIKKRKPRRAAQIAKKRMRRIANNAASTDSEEKDKQKKSKSPTLVIESASESESDSSESHKPKPKPKSKAKSKAKKNTLIMKKRSMESSEEEESEEESEEEERRPSKKRRNSRKYASESEEESEEEPRPSKKRRSSRKYASESEEEEERKPRNRRRKYETESESDSSDDSEDEDEDEDDDDSYDSDEDSDYEQDLGRRKGGSGAIDIVISDLFGGGGGGRNPNKPQKYNLKKEPANVRRFVELVQKEEEEEDTIDNDITYFKSLAPEKQSALMRVLEHKSSPGEVQVPLKFKIMEKVAAKPELNRMAMAKYNALCNIEPSSTEYYKVSHWINGFTSMPLGIYRDLPVKIEDGADKCHEFISKVHKCMEKAIYGHEEPKLQIMQFVSSWIANPKAHGNVLSIHGPPGIGKTSLIKDGVAKALDRPFHFISLGGATDASFLDGHSYTYEGSTWGKIVDCLIQSKCMNPILYFDELDKVSETPKGDEIMNILIHLTDQSQNDRFQDKYFTGIDLDLSRCLFIFSHNNHEKVNPILRDRMYNIELKGFSLKEKMLIAEEYLLPGALHDSGLHEKVSISKDILQYVIENFTGGEAGVRELKRCLQTIASKLNLLRFYNNPKHVPFAIEGFALPFILKKSHVDLFLKKKEDGLSDIVRHMYL